MIICQNGNMGLVGTKTSRWCKCVKPLERVEGIEPSYSAWKAAALPLSYTRITRSPNTSGRRSQPVRRRWFSGQNGPFSPDIRLEHSLNIGRFAAYIVVSINNERR